MPAGTAYKMHRGAGSAIAREHTAGSSVTIRAHWRYAVCLPRPQESCRSSRRACALAVRRFDGKVFEAGAIDPIGASAPALA